MAAGEKEGSSFARWWEFYVVRYGVGTVVGGAIFFFLAKESPNSEIMLFKASKGALDASSLMLLLVYGLVFCYVASAPILVLHAGRSFVLQRHNEGGKIFWGWARVRAKISISLSLSLLVLSLLVVIIEPKLLWVPLLGVLPALWAFFLIFFFQVWVVFTSAKNARFLFNFYFNLSSARKCSKGGLVDSYRHLREHGNAFLIVVFEFFLASVIFAVDKMDVGIWGHALVVFLWVLPASFIWLIGTMLELEFSEYYKERVGDLKMKRARNRVRRVSRR